MNNGTRIKVSFLLFVLMMFYGIAKAQTPEPFTFTVEKKDNTKNIFCKQKYQKDGCRIEVLDNVFTIPENGYVSEMVFLVFELNLTYASTRGLEHKQGMPFPEGNGTVINMALGFENDTYLHKAVSVERSGQIISFSTNMNNFENENKVDAQTFFSTIANYNITEISFLAQMEDDWGYPDLVSWEWKLNTFKTAPTIKAMMQRIVAEQGKSGSNSNSNSGGNAKIDWRTQMTKVMDHSTQNFSNGKYKGQTTSANIRYGLGVYKWEDGSYYWGLWEQGDMNGTGIYICSDGYTYTNCPDCVYYVGKSDKGTCYDKFGNLIYYGDFYNGYPTGTYPTAGNYSSYRFECIDYNDGDKYIGETKDGRRHGQGIYLWKNGDAWFGIWQDGNRHGYGIYLYYKGDVKYGYSKD